MREEGREVWWRKEQLATYQMVLTLDKVPPELKPAPKFGERV